MKLFPNSATEAKISICVCT